MPGAGHPGSDKPEMLSDVPGEGMYFAVAARVLLEGGQYPSGVMNMFTITEATACTIVLAAATGFRWLPADAGHAAGK